MSKKIESKLDRYADALLEMESAKPPQTLADMQKWLAAEGVTVVQSTISRFLESLRSSRAQERLLELVTSGTERCTQVDEAFAENPAPELESLIKLFKTLIFDLTTKGAVQPEMLTLANNLTITVCGYLSGLTKAAFKERELTIEEQKFADSKKDEQTKALEFCLEEAKAFPPVQEMFRAAFAALTKAKAK
jgi:hypothetical protein